MRTTVLGVVPIPSFKYMARDLSPMTLAAERLPSSLGDVLIVGAEGCGDMAAIPLKDLGLQFIPKESS